MQLHFDKEEMRAEVLKYLCVGMPVENAKRIMEDSGFECEESDFDGPSFLRCSAVYKSHLLLGDEIFVDVYHESGVVTDIKVNCHCVGP
jgi:hypothetical protein